MTDDERALVVLAAGTTGLVMTVMVWMELLVRRPLLGLGILIVGIFVATGIVTYDMQSERPNGR